MVNPREGFEIVEGNGFRNALADIPVSIEIWDEIRLGWDWALNRDPTNPSVASNVILNFWVIELSGPPALVLFYEVDEQNRLVTYTNLCQAP